MMFSELLEKKHFFDIFIQQKLFCCDGFSIEKKFSTQWQKPANPVRQSQITLQTVVFHSIVQILGQKYCLWSQL